MSVLASWYTEQENYDKPLVVIIDDVERCSGPVLNDFIVMLRYSSYFALRMAPLCCLSFCEKNFMNLKFLDMALGGMGEGIF